MAGLSVDLLENESDPEVLSLVAESDDGIVGHVAFSPLTAVDDESFRGSILSPLGVIPSCQKQSVGSNLITAGMTRLSAAGVGILLVYGDPAYYGRFGFRAETAACCIPPYELQYPFGWQAIRLDERLSVGAPVPVQCVASLSDPQLW